MRMIDLAAIMLLSLMVADCSASAQGRDPGDIIVDARRNEKYAGTLVEETSYTTDAVQLHREHRQYLLGLARLITEKHDFGIVEKS